MNHNGRYTILNIRNQIKVVDSFDDRTKVAQVVQKLERENPCENEFVLDYIVWDNYTKGITAVCWPKKEIDWRKNQ